jgi:hypothetical protein
MRWLLSISILVCALGLHADDPAAEESPAEPVDLEFLEYLGSLVFGGEGWVGPEDMVVPIEAGEAGVPAPAERPVQYEDAFERDLQEEPGDAG